MKRKSLDNDNDNNTSTDSKSVLILPGKIVMNYRGFREIVDINQIEDVSEELTPETITIPSQTFWGRIVICASAANRLDIIKEILENICTNIGIDADLKVRGYDSAFFYALDNGNLEIIKYIHSFQKSKIEILYPQFKKFLEQRGIALENSANSLSISLEEFNDYLSKAGISSYYVRYDYFLQYLRNEAIEPAIPIDFGNTSDATLIEKAYCSNNVKLVEYVEQEFGLKVSGDSKCNQVGILEELVTIGPLLTLKYLLENYPDILDYNFLKEDGQEYEESDYPRNTILYYAIDSGKPEIIEFLLQKKFNINLSYGGKLTTLATALIR